MSARSDSSSSSTEYRSAELSPNTASMISAAADLLQSHIVNPSTRSTTTTNDTAPPRQPARSSAIPRRGVLRPYSY